MFDFTNTYSKNQLDTKNILNRISELTLWRFYLGTDFTPGLYIRAPYRDDRVPSFQITYNEITQKYVGKDYGSDFYGDVFDYIQYTRKISFREALQTVNINFNLGLFTGPNEKLLSNQTTLKESFIKKIDKAGEKIKSDSVLVQTTLRSYNKSDFEFWNSFGITYPTLKFYNIHCAQRVYNNHKLVYNYSKDDPAYVYYFPITKHIKVYFPKRSGGYRFLGNTNNYQDIQGYYQCDVKNLKNNNLIFTKSMKDVMTIREQSGIDAMAIHGENHRFNKDFIRHCKKYYKNIVSLYDRDGSGMKGAYNLWREYRIPPYFINKNYKSKDVSDLYRDHGSDIVKEFLTTLKNNNYA